MEIDEFLDRELSGLDLNTDDSKETTQNVEEIRSIEPPGLFDNIKASLNKGNIEEAEQSYSHLWHILFDRKLKWDEGLYGQLLTLSRHFLSAINLGSSEVKKKADYIYDLIKKARASLKEGKKDIPYRIYSQVIEAHNSIPNVFFEEKKFLQEQITLFYQELKNTTDNELIKRVYALAQETAQLIDKTGSSLNANDYGSSIASYNKCLEIYSQIPEGFLKSKAPLGIRILEIYKRISIYSEISSLQRQISQPLQPQQTAHFVRDMVIPEKVAGKTFTLPKSKILDEKRERAKKNIEKGLYNEAFKEIEEALMIEPMDAESKAIHAKIKTLQK